MQKTDKVFAGLVVLSLIAFWVIIAPAGVTSRISEAAPSLIEPTPPVVVEKPTPERSTQSRAIAPRLSPAQRTRLKRRNTDTPPEAREMMMQRIRDAAGRPDHGAKRDDGNLRRLQDAPGFKQVY